MLESYLFNFMKNRRGTHRNFNSYNIIFEYFYNIRLKISIFFFYIFEKRYSLKQLKKRYRVFFF